MKQKTYTVYSFNELSPEARERAIEKHRQFLGEQWSGEAVIEDAKQAFVFAGLNIDRVFYRGFWSQGDGACFEGSFDARKVDPAKMREYAPQDAELHRIADALAEIAKAFPEASFTVKHSGHYYHEYMTNFDFACTDAEGNDMNIPQDVEDKLIELARDAMRWIYKRLEECYEADTSEEAVIESIRANEYEFRENGEMD